MDQYIAEAQADLLFRQLWNYPADRQFRPFAWAVLAFADVGSLSGGERAALYREIATMTRPALLDRVSGLAGWKERMGLLKRTEWRLFGAADWRALFHASEDAATGRALRHLQTISPVLVHQLASVPTAVRLPNILALLNRLDVSAKHWDQLAAALADAPPALRPSLLAKASNVTSIGSFWDWFFGCAGRPWQPFPLPQPFLCSPMLQPLRTAAQLRREGRRMANCLAGEVGPVRSGRRVYFRWQGPEPATVQFVRSPAGWRLGRILGRENRRLPRPARECIRRWAELVLSDRAGLAARGEDGIPAAIMDLCERARQTFSAAEQARVTRALRRVRGTPSRAPDDNAFCVVECDSGYVQFLAAGRGEEILCEIQSHRYHPPVENRLTDAVVSLIAACGFAWPQDLENFARWFYTSGDADAEMLAVFALGLLAEVFGHQPGKDLRLIVNLPGYGRAKP